jgi:quercetin dioxygenase-like cupin family protein
MACFPGDTPTGGAWRLARAPEIPFILTRVAAISFTPSRVPPIFPPQPQGVGLMDIMKIGSRPSGKGPADYFTGTVRVDPLFSPPPPARVQGASVTFEPGARTAWHTHPLGQTLVVTAGCGRVQREGGPVEEIRPGDVVWFAPGEKHWHGAAPTTPMTHIAIQEALNDKVVDWMEKVTDIQYEIGS